MMQKLDNRRAAYAMLPVGAETPLPSGFPLPSGRFVISAAMQEPTRLLCREYTQIQDRARGNRVWPTWYGFSAPGFFRIRGNGHSKSHISITGSEKPLPRKGVAPMFQQPIFSVPATTTAPMGGAR